MKNAILITFMSFLCLATTYADHGNRGRSDDDSRYNYTTSSNSEFFTYDGGDDFQRITLVDLEEVWVTETRQVRSTCTRSIPVTRRVCRDVRPGHGYDNDHHRGHGRGGSRHGRPPRQECREETTYRTESYTCYKPETIRTRRPDKRFHANISVEFKNLSRDRYNDDRAEFMAKLNRSHFTLELLRQEQRGESLFFMKDELRTSQYGEVTEISGIIKVLVFDKEEFLRPVRQQIDVRPEVHHGELVLKLGKIQFEKGLGINLTLSNSYGRTLFSGVVPREFVSIRDGRYGEESIVVIDLNRLLYGSLRRGDFLNAQITILLMERNLTLLNNRHLPQLEQSVRASVSVR